GFQTLVESNAVWAWLASNGTASASPPLATLWTKEPASMGGVFTQSVTQVMRRAAEEAVRLNHPYIGPEHILFGLLEDRTVASLLNTYSIQPDEVRRQVESLLEPGYKPLPPGKLPFAPRA